MNGLAHAQNSDLPEPITRIRAPESPAEPVAGDAARVSPCMLTLRQLIDSFKAEMRLLVRAGTYEQNTLNYYRYQFDHLDALGDFPAEALRLHHLAAIDFTTSFVRSLKRLYRWATDAEMVPKDPFRKLSIPPCGARERVLTRPELRRLYLASSRAFRRLLFVQIQTLARPGEIRQLAWGQIDWEKRVFVVVNYKGKKKRRDKLKARAIPFPLTVLRMLRNLYRKSKDQSETGRVFIGHKGEPWTSNSVRCAMRRARVVAGLDDGDEPVVCYHLRHTGATNAVRMDLNLKLVAEVMGHARTTTTERYCHLNTSDMVAAIDRVAARVRRPIAAL